MSAYFVVELEIINSDAMEPYRAAVGATIEQYGARRQPCCRTGAPSAGRQHDLPDRTHVLYHWQSADDYERLHYRGDLIRFVTRLARLPRASMQR